MGAEEPDHEGENLTSDQYRVVVLVLATLVTVVTIAFEMLQHKLAHALSADFRPIVDHLYGELTVMGFIGLILYGSSRLGVCLHARRVVGCCCFFFAVLLGVLCCSRPSAPRGQL
jgi:hypothetical protein